MYAIVNTGGKQYKIQQGDVFRVEKIPGEIGSSVSFDKVLPIDDLLIFNFVASVTA